MILYIIGDIKNVKKMPGQFIVYNVHFTSFKDDTCLMVNVEITFNREVVVMVTGMAP